MSVNPNPIVIIGGGISGVMAARTLLEAGEENVLLLDKGRSLGGRMITREIAGARMDHGAQFFTVHSKEFKQLTDQWLLQGWIKELSEDPNVYWGVDGMNALIRHLADPVDFCVRVRVTKIQAAPDGWILRWISEEQTYVDQTYQEVPREKIYDPGKEATIHAKAIVLAIPVPQALFLLEQGNIKMDETTTAKLQSIDYLPCLTAMLVLEDKPSVAEFMCIKTGLPDSLHSIVNNQNKGISSIPSITIQAGEEWSRENLWRPDQEILEEILQCAEPWLNGARVKEKQLKRWSYSRASQTYGEPFLPAGLHAPLLFAGDAFVSERDPLKIGRVETAVLSGQEAAKHLLSLGDKS